MNEKILYNKYDKNFFIHDVDMMPDLRIDFLMPTASQYGVLHYFTKELYEAFQRQNLTSCRLIDNEKIFESINEDPPDMTVGFNGAPLHPAGVFLCDLIEKPHFCCLMDLSYRYFTLLESPFIHFSCNDRLSCKLIHLKQKKTALFLPPGCEKTLCFDPDISREFEVVLMATFIDFEGRRKCWKQWFPSSICAMMDHAVEIVFSNSDISYIDAFQIAFNDFLIHDMFKKDDQYNLLGIWEQIELYIRGKERVELVKSLPHTKIHIFDSSIDQLNWEGYFQGKHPHLVFHPPVSFEESFDVLKKSKFVINSSPHLRDGAHERVFNALACGAMPIAEANPYMREIFSEGDLLFYRHPDLKGIEEKLQIFSNEEKRQAIVESGRSKVMAAHTWDHRASALMDFLKKERLVEI